LRNITAAGALGIALLIAPKLSRAEQGQESPSPTQSESPPTVTLRDQNSGTMYDLEFISVWGRTSQVQSSAAGLMRDLIREFDSRRPNQRTIDARLARARTLITSEIQNAEERATEERRRQYENAVGQPHALASMVSSLASDSALNSALQQDSGGRLRVSDVWLLDDTSMREMIRLLAEAQRAIQAGTSPGDSLTRAATLFNTAQTAYLRLVGIISQMAQAELAEITGSSLPTREQLLARESQDVRAAGTYYNLRIPREGPLQRRIPTGRRDLEAVAQRRLDAATAMAGQQGRLAYYAVQDLYDNTATETRALHCLISLWDYAGGHGLGAYPDQATFYSNYVQSAALFVAPELNPFRDLYSQDQQDALIRVHLGMLPNAVPTAAQRAQAARDLTEMLMRNQPRKYDYTLFNVFEQVLYNIRSDGQAGIQSLANIRSQRVMADLDYLPYLRGVPPIVRDSQGRQISPETIVESPAHERFMMSRGMLETTVQAAQDIGMPETDPLLAAARTELANTQAEAAETALEGVNNGLITRIENLIGSPHFRFVMARGMLERAVQGAQQSGMPSDDAVLAASRAYLATVRAPPAADRLAEVSDSLYNLTIDLLSIREAELWAENPNLRPTTAAAATAGAQEQLGRARRAFIWSFSTPEVGTAYHANLARRFSDDATNLLMGPAFAMTEASGMYYTRSRYVGPRHPAEAPDSWQPPADGWQPTITDQRASAMEGEQVYLTFLASLSSGPGAALFGPTAADTVPAQSGLFGPARTLALTVGRAEPRFSWSVSPLGDYPEYQPIERRTRPTIAQIDTHRISPVIPANSDLGNHLHDDLYEYVHGEAYVEVSRQFYMSVDPGVDPLLHGFEAAPNAYPMRQDAQFRVQDQALRDRMVAIAHENEFPVDRPLIDSLRERMLSVSAAYSTALAGADDATRTRLLGERQQEANRIMLAILDVRIAQLDSRLSGNVMLADGQPIRASDLTRSRDLRKYTVVRAQEMLAEARALRTRFNAALGTDYFGRGGVDPREAIGIAEMGIMSLTDPEVRDIERPLSVQITAEALLITRDRGSRVSDMGVREETTTFTATQIMITPQGGERVSLERYERENGEANLNYLWFLYQNVQPGFTDLLLLNPANPRGEDPDTRYAGMIVRGATTTDGHSGDFVVRVRRVNAPSRDLEWEAVAEDDGRINPENILYELRTGTLDPVRGDARLEANIEQVAFARSAPRSTAVNFGPTSATLIIRPSLSNAEPPSTAATSRPAAPVQPDSAASQTR
jgi:hypothetical protein